MIKVDLEKVMVSNKKRTLLKMENEINKQEKLIENVKMILSDDFQNDKKLMYECGLYNAITNAEDNVRAKTKIEREKGLISKSDRVFSIDDIKRMAVNYGLRFLPSDMYKGELCPMLPQKIREFKSLGLEVSSFDPFDDWFSRRRSSERGYYILAPKESFELREKPKDPLMFAKLSDGTYYLIHKWGNDLSIMNYLLNIPVRSSKSFVLFNAVLLPLLFLIGFNCDYVLIKAALCVSTILWALTMIISLLAGINAPESDKVKFNDSNWNRRFKD